MSSPMNINPGLDTGTSTQRKIDAECSFSISVSSSDMDDTMKQLDPEFLVRAGCRVIKHPDCCVLCAANNDCARLPVHYQCRCKPEGFLAIELPL
jgi:hypothetical protein